MTVLRFYILDEASLRDLASEFEQLNMSTCTEPTPKTIHCRLRTENPLKCALDSKRRYGHQRGLGNMVDVLLKMGKTSLMVDGKTTYAQ